MTETKLAVRIYHYRVCVDDEGNRVLANMKQVHDQNLTMLAHGGMTEAVVLDGEKVVGEATAYCNDLDQYNKRTGAMIASARALFPILYPEEAVRREEERRRAEELRKQGLLNV